MLPGLVPLVALGAFWHAVGLNVWRHEGSMAQSGPLAAVRALAIRVNPASHTFALHLVRRDYGMKGAWSVDSVPDHAVLAFNAGQFTGGWPWGWLVIDGEERQEPGRGRLGMAFVVDSSGAVALVAPGEIPLRRGHVRLAFQSYPALLVNREPPWELQAAGRGVNLEHRDSRLALCVLDDGTLVVAITRFAALGGVGSTLPWGPTVPEMASYMRGLGCRNAMLLDGGMSSQLLVRDANGTAQQLSNWREVPLGLVVTPRVTRAPVGGGHPKP